MDDKSVKWIKEISRDERDLYVQLQNPSTLDEQMFQRMSNDEFCISCALRNKEKGILMYSIANLVTLDDFLKQYVFEKEEIYIFLEHLFEQAIASNRNKPILLDAKYIFLNEYGDTFYFLVVPVTLGEWMFQKEKLKQWIVYLYKNIQTKTAFEIIGYLVRFCQADEFSLPNLILGIKNMRKQYYPVRFSFLSKKHKTIFRVNEPIHPMYNQEVKDVVMDSNQTQVLGYQNEKFPFLENETDHFDLTLSQITIGRSNENDICLKQNEISSKHATIYQNQGRYYIQDLKSSNGTYLNGKRIQRKMRLKEGMKVCFANVEFIFHDINS